MSAERDVGGIRCTEVLAVLSDFLDGNLDEPTRSRVNAHLAGCDWCERFGGEFAATVAALRHQLGAPEPIGSIVSQRLRERLREEIRRR